MDLGLNPEGGYIMARVGKNIKALRTSQSMTQDDLAELLFVSRQTVSNYETGKSNPDIEMLVRIAEVLKTDPNSLIYGIPRPQGRKKELVRTCAAAVILAVLAAAVLILTPVVKGITAQQLIPEPGMLIAFGLKPWMFLLLGWVIMQAIFLIFGIKPLRQGCIKWIHRIILGVIIAYFVILGPNLILWSYHLICHLMGHSVSVGFSLGPVWNRLVLWIIVSFSSWSSIVFAILGICLRATERERTAPVQQADP